MSSHPTEQTAPAGPAVLRALLPIGTRLSSSATEGTTQPAAATTTR